MKVQTPRQLPLEIKLDDSATFGNYFVSASNRQLLDYLIASKSEDLQQFTYLWGAAGAGRSHLLQSLCHLASAREEAVFFVPLGFRSDYSPAILEGLESMALVCLDDLQHIAGDIQWELALFSLFNRLRDSGTRLVVTATTGPRHLRVQLPDLLSRLQSGLVFQVNQLGDAEKLLALQLRAHARGIELTDEVAAYILQRNERSMRSLFELLDRIDEHSLETKRKITVPLVRQLTGWS